jgi:hypothetical protein
MVTSLAVIALCVMNILTIVYFTQVFHHLENNFDAVDSRFTALEKLFVKMNRNVEIHTETIHDTYVEIGRLKTGYERLRCYVYNSVQTEEQQEGGTTNESV